MSSILLLFLTASVVAAFLWTLGLAVLRDSSTGRLGVCKSFCWTMRCGRACGVRALAIAGAPGLFLALGGHTWGGVRVRRECQRISEYCSEISVGNGWWRLIQMLSLYALIQFLL